MIKSKLDKSNSLGQIAWKRFRKNKLAMFGLTIIVISVVIFILGYLISPDSSPDANEQKPELQIKKPGFAIKLLKIRKNEPDHSVNFLVRALCSLQI